MAIHIARSSIDYEAIVRDHSGAKECRFFCNIFVKTNDTVTKSIFVHNFIHNFFIHTGKNDLLHTEIICISD